MGSQSELEYQTRQTLSRILCQDSTRFSPLCRMTEVANHLENGTNGHRNGHHRETEEERKVRKERERKDRENETEEERRIRKERERKSRVNETEEERKIRKDKEKRDKEKGSERRKETEEERRIRKEKEKKDGNREKDKHKKGRKQKKRDGFVRRKKNAIQEKT